MPPVSPGPMRTPTPPSAAEMKFIDALLSAPSMADFEATFQKALEGGKHAAKITGGPGEQFEVSGEDSFRSITWRRPVAFAAALLGPVTSEQRVAYLDQLVGKGFPGVRVDLAEYHAISTIAGMGGKAIAAGMDVDAALLLFKRTESAKGEAFIDAHRSEGGGYVLSSTRNLASGRPGITFYHFSKDGTAINPDTNESLAVNPLDNAIPKQVTKTDRMIWTKHRGLWEQNTQVDFAFDGSPRDRAQFGNGFQEGLEALMGALKIDKAAVVAAHAVVVGERDAKTRGTGPLSLADFTISLPPRPKPDHIT